ncbi:hypothetical protein V2W45_1470205 [Cenococcum geophilum]
MATLPPVLPFILTEKTTQISSWLKQLLLTPPVDEEHRLLKCKRASLEPIARQRRNIDDLLPGQSASAIGLNARPLTLGNSNTFSPPGSRVGALTLRRGNSLSREIIAALRVVLPPITTEPLDGVEPEPPARVMAVPAAFSKTATRDLSDPDLDSAVRAELEYILRKMRGRDENAWCDDVVRPMVRLALRLQSQNIDFEFLSRATDADYTLFYSHDHGNKCVSYMTDAFTKTTAVFSGIEVEPSDGDKLEAEYQLSIWMAASLREAVRILEFGNAAMSSVMWRNIVEYGLDEGPDGFWGGFLKSVLERLVVGDDGDMAKRGGANGEGTDGGSVNLDEGLWMGSGALHVPV